MPVDSQKAPTRRYQLGIKGAGLGVVWACEGGVFARRKNQGGREEQAKKRRVGQVPNACPATA